MTASFWLNDEGQAAEDLSLAKKLVAVNPIIARDVIIVAKLMPSISGES